MNGTPVVAEAKKQINGQENTASRQKAEGVAMDKSTQTENDATVRELRLRVEALEEIVLKLTAERTSSSSSSRPAMPSSRATASSQKMVSRSSGEVSSDRTSRSFRRRGRDPAAIRERNACSGTDDVSQVMALATSAEQVDLYHFFTNMQVWAICQDQCEYHTIQKAEIPVWDILAWNMQVKVETSDWNNTE